MCYFLKLHLLSRKSKLNLDRANSACMGHCPSYIQSRDRLSLPIVADFCTHLFSKGVSFSVAVVSTFASYPFFSIRNCKF